MRQYKFRGKSMETGKWVFGYLVSGGLFGGNVDQCWIFSSDFRFHQVFPETVGQFTGMQDMEDTEIYEGDIVEINMHKIPVTYENGCFYTIRGTSRYRLGGWSLEAVNVVGNIFDNPEIITHEQ